MTQDKFLPTPTKKKKKCESHLYIEDSVDMDMSPLKSQNYPKGNKDYHFKADNDENEHQLSLRMASLGAGEFKG